jgi:WD40 repeat protein
MDPLNRIDNSITPTSVPADVISTNDDSSHATLVGKFEGRAVDQLDFSNQSELIDKDLIDKIVSNSRIERLNLQGCSNLRLKNKTIRVLAERLKNLKELDLRRCTSITDRAIEYISDTGLPLKKLILNNMTGIRPEVLRKLNAKSITFTTDVAFNECVLTLEGHANLIFSLIELKAGRLASGSCDKTIKLWDTTTGNCLATLIGHADWVHSLIELRDGRLASASRDKIIKLWDTTTGSCLNTLTGHTDEVRSLIELKDGHLASASHDKTIKLWDTAEESCFTTLTGHIKGIYSLIELKDGRLASASDDKTVKLWDTTIGSCLVTLAGHTGWVRSLIELKDGRLASVSFDETIKLWVI